MNRPIRIGLIAEGEAEQGRSIQERADPQNGGKKIPRDKEGGLHILIRKEIQLLGYECDFVYRHPSLRELKACGNDRSRGKYATGEGVFSEKNFKRLILTWKAHEVDLIVLVADADKDTLSRQNQLQARQADVNAQSFDIEGAATHLECAVGVAIINFDTWLLADLGALTSVLEVSTSTLPSFSTNLEDERSSKHKLDELIKSSSIFGNVRLIEAKWHIAQTSDTVHLKTRCPEGYGAFVEDLELKVQATSRRMPNDF